MFNASATLPPDGIPLWLATIIAIILVATFVVITAPERRKRRSNRNWRALNVPERVRK